MNFCQSGEISQNLVTLIVRTFDHSLLLLLLFLLKLKHLLFNEGAFESRLGVGVRVPGLLLHRQRGLGQQRLEPARLKIQKMFHDLPVRLKWLKNLA